MKVIAEVSQDSVLAALADGPMTSMGIAATLGIKTWDERRRVLVQQALQKLKRRGLVELLPDRVRWQAVGEVWL